MTKMIPNDGNHSWVYNGISGQKRVSSDLCATPQGHRLHIDPAMPDTSKKSKAARTATATATAAAAATTTAPATATATAPAAATAAVEGDT